MTVQIGMVVGRDGLISQTADLRFGQHHAHGTDNLKKVMEDAG
ncbi:hypothetical protein [Spongiimicrobium sp. 2-473A-2-J]